MRTRQCLEWIKREGQLPAAELILASSSTLDVHSAFVLSRHVSRSSGVIHAVNSEENWIFKRTTGALHNLGVAATQPRDCESTSYCINASMYNIFSLLYVLFSIIPSADNGSNAANYSTVLPWHLRLIQYAPTSVHVQDNQRSPDTSRKESIALLPETRGYQHFYTGLPNKAGVSMEVQEFYWPTVVKGWGQTVCYYGNQTTLRCGLPAAAL